MNEKTIIDFFALQNKWWEDKKFFPFQRTKPFKRSDYYYLFKNKVDTEEAIVITGSRGVGKSTVLLEIIRSLLGFKDEIAGKEIALTKIENPPEEGTVDKKRILYVTFEESSLKKITIIDILKIYAKYILRQDLSELNQKIYVFFDEIQNVEDWGTQIKLIQDLNYPIKIFLSGSSSVNMIHEASKAARRVDMYSMYPLKFSDYLRYKLNDEEFVKIMDKIKNFRVELFRLVKENDAGSIYESFLQYYAELKRWQTKIEIHFQEYLIKGGYPALLDMKEEDYQAGSQKLKDTFWLGFHKDLILAKGIGDPGGMISLTEYIASISSCETNYTSLMEHSGATSNTGMLKKYLYHLEKAHLVSISNRISNTQTKRGHSFKIYLNDIAIRNMLQGLMNELLLNNQVECGYAIETLIYDHALRLYFKVRPYMPLLYCKDKRTSKEVDVILKLNSHMLPIEVKKADSPNVSDVSGLRIFCKNKIPGVVVCGKKIDIEENIVFIPHWLFALLC